MRRSEINCLGRAGRRRAQDLVAKSIKIIDGAAETNDVEEVAERCEMPVQGAVVRHGPFRRRRGDAGVVAFSRVATSPALYDFTKRRRDRRQQNEDKQDQFLSTRHVARV